VRVILSIHPSIHPNERKYEAVKFHLVSQLQPTKGKSQKSKVKSLADRFETSALLQDNQDKTGQNRTDARCLLNVIRSIDRSIGRSVDGISSASQLNPSPAAFFPINNQQLTTNACLR
jgi:hypothetical protein